MKVNVYDSIRFHAMQKRRQPENRPARLMVGMAALAFLIAASVGVLHSGVTTKAGPAAAHYAAESQR